MPGTPVTPSVVIAAIEKVVIDCSEAGWDGYGAEPVSRAAAARAAELVRALPAGFALPQVAPDPDGAISLDWIGSRVSMVSVSVGASGRLGCAWVRSESGHEVVEFDGKRIPQSLLGRIEDTLKPAGAAPGQ